MTLDADVRIRFPADAIAMVRRLAEAEGMDVSAWIRREVDREISRREGRCGHCGQEIR